MRLAIVQKGKRTLKHRAVMSVAKVVMKQEPPDVLKVMTYRPEYFGKAFTALTQHVMRGPSEWSVGHRELFAAFTARQHECRF